MKYKIININDVSESDYQYYYSLMSSENKARVERYKFAEDKKCSVAGEMLARKMLSEKCNTPPESIVFKRLKNGKPYAVNINSEFSISHSGNYVICAVSDSPVGADIELIRKLPVYPDKFFTDREKDCIFNSHNENETKRRFFEIWTFKEALIKMHGEALSKINDYECFDYKGNKQVLSEKDYIATVVY